MTFSIINAFCCFIGFIPLIYSLQSRDSYYLGDHAKAAEQSKTAKMWNIIVLVLSMAIFILLAINAYFPIVSFTFLDDLYGNFNNTTQLNT